MTLALVLAALLAAACVVFVARPFLREPAPSSDLLDEPGELETRALRLAEERDRALAALKELEFDHRTGKVADDDYRALVGPLRAAAARAMRALEPHASEPGGTGRPPLQSPAMVEIPEPPRPPSPAPVPDPSPAPVPEPSPTPVPEPYPPPDEATPPEPARVPEPGPL